mgnify:CR=1 FL=1
MEIEEIDKKACLNNEDTYIDPETKCLVFTKKFLLKKGSCCNSGCRHCPYKHIIN